MHESRVVTVILTRELLEHLRRQAQQERVSMSWLVAARVCPTIIGVELWRRVTWGVADASIGPITAPVAWN